MSKIGDRHYTKEEENLLRENYNLMTYDKLAELVGRKTPAVYSKCRRMGLIETDMEQSKRRSGALNGNWKGGISQLKSGYVRDNIAGKNVHTLVMEEFLGREINFPEIVHHIDGNKSNNNIENLMYCEDISTHRHMHCQLEEIAFELVREGVIKFDKETGKYHL